MKKIIVMTNFMELTYNLRNKILLASGIAVFGVAILLLAQLVFANSTGSILPSSDGTYLQWTPKTGTTHYAMVDESTCNGTTDYNSTNTVGNRDSYGVSLASIPNGSTITAIGITPCASRNKKGGGSATMNVFYRFNGVDSADAGNFALTGTTPTQLTATTFSGLSHMKGPASSLQVGAVLSAGNKGARLGRIAVVVTYIPASPTVSTNAATSITTSSATLNGSANPNGASTTGWFRYSATNPGTCNDVFGIRVPTSGGTNLGSGTSPVAYSNGVSGLSSGTTYYYCAIANNSGGTGFSGIVSFTTVQPAPVVPSDPTNLTATASSSSAVLNWSQSSTNEEGFKVERGTDGVNFTEIAIKGINVTNHVDPGLSPGTYYYRVRAFNVIGNSGYSNSASTTIP